MSLRSEVGRTIEKVVARKSRPRARGTRKQTIAVTALKPMPNKPGYFIDKKGTAYRVQREPITGLTLTRQDGAKFRLNKSGKWEIIGAGKRKKH